MSLVISVAVTDLQLFAGLPSRAEDENNPATLVKRGCRQRVPMVIAQ